MTTACRQATLAAVQRRSLRRGVLALAALAALAAAPAAQAQYGPGPQFLPAPRGYLSLGAGASSSSVSCGGSAQCDRVGNAVRAAAGVFVTPFAAFELAAADFGDSRIGTPYGDAELNVRMAGVGIALTLDYGARFNGLLRFGVAQVEATWQAPWASPAESRNTSAEGYYGLTLGVMLSPNLAAELSFDGTRYETGDGVERVDALTLGLSLRF
jgi:hypothetical protein